MRIWVTCCRGFGSIASVWVVPLLLSLVVSLVLCTAIGTKTTILPFDVLLSLSRDMLSLLGVIAAILIAVITTMYVLSAQTRGQGFRSFLQALDGVRGMPAEIRSRGEVLGQDDGDAPARLTGVADTLDEFVVRLNDVRPTWPGFESDRDLENVMAYYSGGIRAELKSIASNLEGTNKLEVDQLANRFDGRARSMVVGLLTIQLGIVGKQFVERLLKLSLSLTCLLVLSLSLRASAEPVSTVDFGRWSWIILTAYTFLAAAVLAHVIAFICAAAEWWGKVQAIEIAWEGN